jgi:hypothetical protein
MKQHARPLGACYLFCGASRDWRITITISETLSMTIKRTFVLLAFLLVAQTGFARQVGVQAVFSGVGPGVLLNGDATGFLSATGELDNGVMTLSGSLRTEFDDNGTLSVWTQNIYTVIDFEDLEGSWQTSNCVDVSGPVFCALAPPSSGTWDSVAGVPTAFLTTENGTTVTWDVTLPQQVPTLSLYGIALTVLGLLLVAVRRLTASRPSR